MSASVWTYETGLHSIADAALELAARLWFGFDPKTFIGRFLSFWSFGD